MAATLGIREKLALTFVGVFLAMIAISLVFLFSQQRLKDTEAQQNQAFQVRHSLQILRAAVLDQETGIRGFSISPQKAFLEPYERGVVAARTALSDLAKDASNAERVLLVTRIDQSLSHWQQHYAAPILTDQNGNTVNAMAGRELFDELRQQINALEVLENARLKQNNRQITEQFTHNLHLALLCLFASTVFMVLGLLGVSHWVSEPITQLTRTVATIHNPTIHIPYQDWNDEIGAIARALETLRSNNQLAERHHWVRSHVSELANDLQNCSSLGTFCQRLVSGVAEVLEVERGALFIKGDSTGTLHFMAGYGLRGQSDFPHPIYPSEGLIGQCLVERKRLRSALPPEAGAKHPRWHLVLPLLGRDELLGVVALWGVVDLHSQQEEYLAAVLRMGGLNLESLVRALRTQTLLEESQAQAEELMASQEALRQQQSELSDTNQALERTSQYKSEFLANMSHELRTPLNSLLLLNQYLLRNGQNNLNDEQLQSLSVMQESGGHLLDLINNILDLSRMDADKMPICLEHIAVTELVASLSRQFQVVAEDRGLQWQVEVVEPLPVLYSDPLRLRQILVNLLGNAFKFTLHGSVRLKVVSAEEGLWFSVKDSGIGIAKDKQSRIFEAFEQVDGSTAREYGGTGLGLALCKGLAKRLGGRIQLSSQPQQGSEFSLWLPAQSAMPSVSIEDAAIPDAVQTEMPNRDEATSEAPRLWCLHTPAHWLAWFAGWQPVWVADPQDPSFQPQAGDTLLLHLSEHSQLAAWQPWLAGQRLVIHLSYTPDDAQWLALHHLSPHLVSESPFNQERLQQSLHAWGQPTPSPAASSEVGNENRDEASLGVSSGVSSGKRPYSLLVVDDDLRNSFALSRTLQSQGYNVAMLQDARKVIQHLSQQPVDVLLLDIMMPNLDGLACLQALRQAGHSLPVIAVTAKAMPGDKERCLAAGANDYLTKPLSLPALQASLARWLA